MLGTKKIPINFFNDVKLFMTINPWRCVSLGKELQKMLIFFFGESRTFTDGVLKNFDFFVWRS